MTTLKKYYFPHDENSRNNQKMLKIRAKFNNTCGYGLFWMFIESMSESSTGKIDGSAIAELSLSYGVAISYLTEFIDFCLSIGLFQKDENGSLYTERMVKHSDFRNERSISGSIGAAKRWENNAKIKNSSANSSATEQLIAIKEKKIKEKNICIVPTVQEVTEYCKERNNTIDPEYFVNKNSAIGWVNKQGLPYKDWKAVIRTWEKFNKVNKQGGIDEWFNKEDNG